MTINLAKGQRVSLAKQEGGALSRVRMGLGWDAVKKRGFFGALKAQTVDLDASCLMFDGNGRLLDQV
ncbi:MAG: TerD family protein, partial [Mycobacteriaceae bacterium]